MNQQRFFKFADIASLSFWTHFVTCCVFQILVKHCVYFEKTQIWKSFQLLTVLCWYVNYFRRVVTPEMCEYFNVKVCPKCGIKSECHRRCLPDWHNSVHSRSVHNRFPNQCTRTRRKTHIVTSTPNAPFPVTKRDQIWSHARMTTKTAKRLVYYRIVQIVPTP